MLGKCEYKFVLYIRWVCLYVNNIHENIYQIWLSESSAVLKKYIAKKGNRCLSKPKWEHRVIHIYIGESINIDVIYDIITAARSKK